ncbi:phosphoesterase [Alicyclobacillus acidoterrestris]|nr:phosphoesterase [Alicyclobacillus acidoterrestris]
MKLCIVSDTHLRTEELHAAALVAADADLILHAGDEVADAKWLTAYVDVPVIGVAGNWDTPTQEYPLERVVAADEPILLVHGHRLGVKASLWPLVERAKAVGARVAVYGHTHIRYVGVEDSVLVVNPGSLAQPRGGNPATFARVDSTRTSSGIHYRVEHWTTAGAVVSEFEWFVEK